MKGKEIKHRKGMGKNYYGQATEKEQVAAEM